MPKHITMYGCISNGVARKSPGFTEVEKVTITMHWASWPPSLAFAVMVALPGAIAKMVPFSLTRAILLLLEAQLTPWLLALLGLKVATRVSDMLAGISNSVLLRLMPAAFIALPPCAPCPKAAGEASRRNMQSAAAKTLKTKRAQCAAGFILLWLAAGIKCLL
jgi:hypothetical protein